MKRKAFARKVKYLIKQPVRFAAKDWALGFAFPRTYAKMVAKYDVDPRRALFLDVKSRQMPDSFPLVMAYLKGAYDIESTFVGLGQNENAGWVEYYKRCLALMGELARAKYVFVCDACDVLSCLPLRPETKAVQLWHACGAFKKFGMSTADKIFGGSRREKERHPFYENLSLVTVSSAEVCWAYREAMVLDQTPDVVQPLGVSRTDVFFDATFLAEARAIVETAVPSISNRKVILYAPTFRGRVGEATGPDALDIEALAAALSDDYVLLIKHHPYVKKPPAIPAGCEHFAFMVPQVPTDILMAAADVCISDYSSIVFEYSLLDRPMAFFAYDLEEYDDWRGFYYNYDELTPGPVLRSTEEVLDYLLNLDERFDAAALAVFREKFMAACDGRATERICRAVMGDESVSPV